jgi:hypothetical protein
MRKVCEQINSKEYSERAIAIIDDENIPMLKNLDEIFSPASDSFPLGRSLSISLYLIDILRCLHFLDNTFY